MRRSRPFADSGGTMEAGGGMHGRASGVPAAQREGSDDDDDSYVEITIDVRDDSVTVHERPRASGPHGVPVPGGGSDGEGDVTLPARTLEKRSSSHGHDVLHNASARIKQVSEELRRFAASGGPSRIGRSSFAAAAYPLTFVSRADVSAGWAAVERRFDDEANDGLLHRSKFAKCIGMKELAFAGELFDALARRRHISGDSIDKLEMLELWDQISDPSFDSRLHTFIDMIDKDADGRISKEDVKEMIELSAKANNLTIVAQHSEEYARHMMEELDTYNFGYIEVFELERLLRETASHPPPVATSTDNSNLSQRLRPTAKPNALLQWYRDASFSLNQQLRLAPYACERMARPLRSSARPVDVLGAAVFPDPASAVSLRFSKPQGFRYLSGQYVFLNCPAVSRSQWRPFYITSAPQDDHVSVHIKTLGEWTWELNNVFSKVCPRPTEGKGGILRAEYDQNGTISNLSFPKVLMDGPYGTLTQDYKQYDVVLLMGLDIGAAPMISIIKNIINNMKQVDGDDESSNRRTHRAYFYWVNQEQGSFEWFRGVMDEVVEKNDEGVIKLHTYCSSVHEEGDTRSMLISMLQSLNHAKHGVDVVSGARIRTHFGRPNWRGVYERIALRNREQRVGVFYCGTPTLTKELSELAQNFSRKTMTKFEFHNANF